LTRIIYRRVAGTQKAVFLEAIAKQIEALGSELIKKAMEETNLPEARLIGERGRTCNQLRQFAALVKKGNILYIEGPSGGCVAPLRTKGMLAKLDAAFAKAGKKRGKGFQIIITPPIALGADAMKGYADLGVDRLVLNLGGQKPEQVDRRLPEIGNLVKMAA
jgi:hypothetical protein